MLKVYLTTLGVVIIAASIWLGVIYAKVGRLNVTIAEGQTQIAKKDTEIAEARASIDIQNQRIAAFILDADNATASFVIEKERISKRYEYLLAEARKKQTQSPTCANTLEIIEQSQREFLYE